MKTIFINDAIGAPVLKYIVVDDTYGPVFYGGNSNPAVQLDNGPHVVHHEGSLLDLLARLANEDGSPYSMNSTFSPLIVRLRPEMLANEVAAVLGIDVKAVLDRYSLLVRPPA